MNPDKASVNLRSATVKDIEIIFNLIQALAEYEKLSHQVVGTPEQLQDHLFGNHAYAEVILADVEQKTVGFALFFHNYSTFLTQPGIYLEDLFVLPDYRRQGIGKALIIAVANIAVSRGCGRLEWSVLDWNQPAIDFYRGIGAAILDEWKTCRVSEKALYDLKLEEIVTDGVKVELSE